MGIQFRLSDDTTVQPHRLSVDDMFAMVEAGILGADERVELFDGVLVEMNAKNIRHETMRNRLMNWLARHLPEAWLVASELGSRFAEHVYFEPDIIVVDAAVPLDQLNPKTVPLIIEVSDTTLAYDAGAKRDRYAALGLPEYWVIDLGSETILIHREPDESGYGQVERVAFDAPARAQFAPDLAVRLSEIAG